MCILRSHRKFQVQVMNFAIRKCPLKAWCPEEKRPGVGQDGALSGDVGPRALVLRRQGWQACRVGRSSHTVGTFLNALQLPLGSARIGCFWKLDRKFEECKK